MAMSGSWSISWESSTWSGRPKGYRWKGNYSRSGNTITLSGMTLQMYMVSGTGWGTGTDTVTVTGGGAQSVSFTMSGTESNTVGLGNTSFGINTGDTAATIQCVIAGENTGQTTIYFDAGYTDPSQPSVSILERYANGAKFRVSISSYGNPCCENGRWIEAGIAGQNAWQSPSLRSAIVKNTTSADIIVNNGSTQAQTLTVKSNTQYWYGGYATNTQRNNKRIPGQFYTLPANPVGSSFNPTGTGTATFNVTDASEGSGQVVQLQYRYKAHSASDYGSWTNAGASGNKQTRTVNLSGLSSGTAYDVQVRALAGSSDYSGTNTYENAFTTNQVSVTITGRTCVYSNDQANTTFSYIVSAAGASSDAYDIYYSISDGSSIVASSTLNSQSTSGSFSVLLASGGSYTMTIKSRPTGQTSWGAEATYDFTTPTFVPSAPTISNVKWRTEAARGFRWGITFDLAAATPGEGETFDNMYWKVEIYDSTTNQWVEAHATQSVASTTYSGVVNTCWDAMRYPKIALSAWQTNTLGKISPVSKVVYVNRPLAVGVIVYPNGNKQYTVGVKTKGTDGTLYPGDYSSPVVIK